MCDWEFSIQVIDMCNFDVLKSYHLFNTYSKLSLFKEQGAYFAKYTFHKRTVHNFS